MNSLRTRTRLTLRSYLWLLGAVALISSLRTMLGVFDPWHTILVSSLHMTLIGESLVMAKRYPRIFGVSHRMSQIAQYYAFFSIVSYVGMVVILSLACLIKWLA